MASKERLQQTLERKAAVSSALTFAWRDSIVSEGGTSCSDLKTAEVSQWKTVKLSFDACVWRRFLMTVLIYINSYIVIFDRVLFDNFCIFISAAKTSICTDKTTYLSIKKQNCGLLTQEKVEIFAKCLRKERINFGFVAACTLQSFRTYQNFFLNF